MGPRGYVRGIGEGALGFGVSPMGGGLRKKYLGSERCGEGAPRF